MEPTIEKKPKKRLNFKIWSREIDKKILKFVVIILKFIVIIAVLTASVIVIKDEILWNTGYYDDYMDEELADLDLADEDFEGSDCNVQAVTLHGELTTYISPENLDENWNTLSDQVASEDLVYYNDEAEKDDNIKAIIVEIDSYGGYPVAAEEVANALKKAQKPTVALIREGGVSAAYWVASAADVIFASEISDVGSIAVTFSYLDYVKQNQQEGITYNQLSSGKFKDSGDPDKPLSAEERKLLMRDVEVLHQKFVEVVAENRGLDIEKVRQLADGSTMLGQMALENGLIDRIGGEYEVREYLKEKIGEEIEICW